MEEFISIKEAANLLNISIDTLRRWDKKGLIRSYRAPSNHRIFKLTHLKSLSKRLSNSEGVNRYSILQSPQTNYTVLETFAGAGGLALGLKNAGLKTNLCVELDKDSCTTLRANGNWEVKRADMNTFDFGKYAGQFDVVAGGFPCQAFSYAGLGKGLEDARGTLFYSFASCIDVVKPKVFLAENVRGLLTHDKGKTFNTILNVFDSLGYKVSCRVLRAQFYDVPQKRERLIFIGVRKELDLPIYFPKEKDYTVSIREALQDVPASVGMSYSAKKHKIMSYIPEGGYWRDLPIELQMDYMGKSFHLEGGKTGMARRLAWDEPSLTLTCNPAQKQTERCHPSETRPFTVREYARLQTFPDHWQFCGSMSSQYKQIGNAVPVNLAYHVGRCLLAILDKKFYDSEAMVEVKSSQLTNALQPPTLFTDYLE